MVETDCARPVCRVARLSVVMIFELTPARFEFQVDVEEKLFLTKLHNLSRTLNGKRDDTDNDSGSALRRERKRDEFLSPLLSLTFSSLSVQLGPATGDRARNRMGDPREASTGTESHRLLWWSLGARWGDMMEQCSSPVRCLPVCERVCESVRV